MDRTGQLDLSDFKPRVVAEDQAERHMLAERMAQRTSWVRVADLAEELLKQRALGDADREAFSRLRDAAFQAAWYDPQQHRQPGCVDLAG